jgi:peptidoglycan/LPS O-acetylase OafA/YrhL
MTQPASSRVPSPSRHPEIDWIKAFSIVTVVLIHSLPGFMDEPFASEELWLQAMTRFAVPGFLFASGFLYAAAAEKGAGWRAITGQRLKRLLIPYLLFSLFAFVYPMPGWGGRTSLLDEVLFGSALGPFWGSLLDALLFGSALGPYYYVFVIFWFVLATPLISMIPRAVLPLAVALALALNWGFESFQLGTESFFWWFRNPLHWLAPFLLGWTASLYRETIRAASRRHPSTWIAAAAGLWAAAAVYIAIGSPGMLMKLVSWLEIYASLGLIFIVSAAYPAAPRAVLWLSEASYSIYLGHLFFVDALVRAIPRVPGLFDPLRLGAVWAGGVLGAATLVASARLMLGARRARIWLG